MFGNLDVLLLSLDDFDKKINVEENCKSIRENSIKKAVETAKISGKLSLADDSGLEVDALNGVPGVYSARFAGEGCTYKDNNKKLLNLMKDIPLKKRSAKFVCVFALADRKGFIKTATGICMGKITLKEIGKNGFGYDPIFIPNGYKKTFAQMNLDEKNKISHRSKASSKMKIFLKKFINKNA